MDAETAAQVEEAVLAAYDGARIHHIEAEDEGYEAYILTADGQRLEIELDSSFAITGEEEAERRGPGGPRGMHGEPVDEAIAQQIEKAILAAYDGATVDGIHAEGEDADGQPVYEARVRTADGQHLHITLDDGFVITEAEEMPAPGERGFRGPGGFGGPGMPAPLDEDTAAKVEAAVQAAYPQGEVLMVFAEPDGEAYEAHVRTAAGEIVHVLIDESFTVTGTEDDSEDRPGDGV